MLKKLSDVVSFCLLPLMAILFIAVGMPLVHPAIHNHIDHHNMSLDHGAEHFPAMPDEEKTHECPICDFLATGQLYTTGLGPLITTNKPVVKIVPINQIHLTKTSLLQVEPRAPPLFTPL